MDLYSGLRRGLGDGMVDGKLAIGTDFKTESCRYLEK